MTLSLQGLHSLQSAWSAFQHDRDVTTSVAHETSDKHPQKIIFGGVSLG